MDGLMDGHIFFGLFFRAAIKVLFSQCPGLSPLSYPESIFKFSYFLSISEDSLLLILHSVSDLLANRVTCITFSHQFSYTKKVLYHTKLLSYFWHIFTVNLDVEFLYQRIVMVSCFRLSVYFSEYPSLNSQFGLFL